MSTAPPTAEELKAQKVYQATNVTLDRTTSGIIRGAINTPIKQLKPEQRLLLEKARVRDQFSKGKISADQALNRLGISAIQFEKEAHERTIRWGQQAARAGKSEKVKQDTIREKAAQQGVAVGTISSNGTAPVSNQSRIANNATVTNFAKAQTVTQAQRESRVKVTTPDGKERTFKNRETAEKFVSRTEGSYVKEKQGPIKPTKQFTVNLTENKPDDSFRGPYGSLQYNYGEQYEHPLGSAFESSLKSLDEFQLYKPKDPTLAALKTVVDPLAGLSKASLSTFASLGNLGILAGAYVKGREQSITKPIDVPPTLVGNFIGNIIEGKGKDEQIKDAYGYVTSRGIPTSAGELGEIGLGGLGGVKAAAKLIPIRASKYEQAGVKILQSSKVTSRAPVKGPLVEVKPKSISIGYGTKTKPIISKVGDKITLGGPDLSGISSVKISAATGKQTQRGVKLAADSTQYEQSINKQLLPKVQGLSKDSISRGKTIEEIIDITTSKSKDTKTAESLPEEFFSSVTPTEQPSFVGALTKAQKKIFNPIGKYEGSVSQAYFVLPKFMRQAGDVDLHASTYGKAAKQVKDIQTDIIPDPGRVYKAVTSDKTKSAKIFVEKIDDPFPKVEKANLLSMKSQTDIKMGDAGKNTVGYFQPKQKVFGVIPRSEKNNT